MITKKYKPISTKLLIVVTVITTSLLVSFFVENKSVSVVSLVISVLGLMILFASASSNRK